MILLLALLVASPTTSVATGIGVLSAFVTAITAFLSVRATRKQAQAANTTAEGNAIKAITEANGMALQSLRNEVTRLAERVEDQEAELASVKGKLAQERQWTVRLIRALNQAGVDIPARPDQHVTTEDELTTDEIAVTLKES